MALKKYKPKLHWRRKGEVEEAVCRVYFGFHNRPKLTDNFEDVTCSRCKQPEYWTKKTIVRSKQDIEPSE